MYLPTYLPTLLTLRYIYSTFLTYESIPIYLSTNLSSNLNLSMYLILWYSIGTTTDVITYDNAFGSRLQNEITFSLR